MSSEGRKPKNFMNPYLGGVLLGLVLLAALLISGRGLGAAGALNDTVASAVKTVAPSHYSTSQYYMENATDTHPMNTWIVYQVLGLIVGGFLSGVISGRTNWKVEHSPKITSRRRLIFALAGGLLFGFGSQLGKGCTTGSALSGMAVLSVSGFVSMAAIFGTAFILAYFFRKNWI